MANYVQNLESDLPDEQFLSNRECVPLGENVIRKSSILVRVLKLLTPILLIFLILCRSDSEVQTACFMLNRVRFNTNVR